MNTQNFDSKGGKSKFYWNISVHPQEYVEFWDNSLNICHIQWLGFRNVATGQSPLLLNGRGCQVNVYIHGETKQSKAKSEYCKLKQSN